MSQYLAVVIKMFIVFMSLIVLTFCIGNAYAKTIKIGVEGMVCDFCAQSIEKVFLKQPGVEKVDVNLEVGKVTVKMADVFEDNEDGISDERIKQLFLDAGYDVSKIERD
jgi:copper chaperone CopZ|tara:strand:+ start:887 stop:1213 length:327 start_codon:yes stop_codon:yes gene_type:complete